MTHPATLPAADWRQTPIAHVLGPMQEFIHGSTSGGLVLLAAAALALLLANSPLAAAYDAVLHAYVGITAGPFTLQHSLLHWINDGLMAIFFFLVGLEIKREVLVGELADRRAALLPVVAALGGALVPAVLYTVLTWGGPGAAGWGVPMATDIAFALGVLALLGDRIPFALKVFLTAVAIVDDLLAVLVIALFYSGGLNLVALAAGLGLLVLLGLLMVSISYALALWLRDEDALAPLLNTVTLPVLLLSGVLLPLSLAPGWLQGLAALNPLSHAVEAARALFNEQLGDPSIPRALAILGALAVAAFAGASRSFNRAAA